MQSPRWTKIAALLLCVGVGVDANGADVQGVASPARLQSHTALPSPHPILQQDITLACYEGTLSVLLNPGCFMTVVPPQPGDCVSSSGHFMVQYIFPDVSAAHRVLGFRFLNNDAATVFPSAGLLQLPMEQGSVRFPTVSELANLQVTQIQGSADTSMVTVNLEDANIIVLPGSTTALVVVLQFPSGGRLLDIGVGPGIAADSNAPDQPCDFFTVDGGVHWFSPAPCSPGDPSCNPLDWGFALLLAPLPVSLESMTWSGVKSLYHTP